MTVFFVPVPFLRVGSSTLISVRDTVFGKVTAGATATITMPTNGASDVVVCMLGNDATAPNIVPTTPSGFTSIIDEGTTAGNCLAAYCVNPGASISYTNASPSRDMAYIFRSYSRVDTSSVLSGTATKDTFVTNGDPDPPSMTTSHDNAMVVVCGWVETNETSYSAGSGYTELTVASSSDPDGSGQTCVVMMANKIRTTAGSEDPGAFTNAAVGTERTTAFTFALKPA